MDLRAYYQKIRKLEAQIPDESAVIVSMETSDGGSPGHLNEVRRELAARMVVEGRARLATDEEATAFRQQQAKTYEQARQEEAAAQRRGVLTEPELRAIRSALRQSRQG